MAQGVETQLICDFCRIHGIWQILESETETDTTTYLTIYIHTACPHHWGFPIVPELIFLEPESIIPACTEILHFSWDLLQIRCWEHHALLLLTKILAAAHHQIRERPSAGGSKLLNTSVADLNNHCRQWVLQILREPIQPKNSLLSPLPSGETRNKRTN